MIIYPAMHIRQGRVVGLLQGNPDAEMVFDRDPLACAQRWQAAGAIWIHLVDLDSVFGDASFDTHLVEQIVRQGLNVQAGGGLRTPDDIAWLLDHGAARVVLGTMLAEDPSFAGQAVMRYGTDAIAAALDVWDDRVATHGWQRRSNWHPEALGQRLAHEGIMHALFTDIRRTGTLSGMNTGAIARLYRHTRLSIQAAGGIVSLQDIITLWQIGSTAGIVINTALYRGAFSLENAIRIAGTPL